MEMEVKVFIRRRGMLGVEGKGEEGSSGRVVCTWRLLLLAFLPTTLLSYCIFLRANS